MFGFTSLRKQNKLMLLDFLCIEDFEIEAQSCLFSLTQIKKIGALNEVQRFFKEEEEH